MTTCFLFFVVVVQMVLSYHQRNSIAAPRLSSILSASTFHEQTHINNEMEISAAERISKATSITELLEASHHIIYPGEETKAHQQQLVHQRKRQRAATTCIIRMVRFLVGISTTQKRKEVVEQEAFRRLVVSATSPLSKQELGLMTTSWVDNNDILSYIDCLRGLATLGPLPNDCVQAITPLFVELDGALVSPGSCEKLSLTPAKISALEYSHRRLVPELSLPALRSTHEALLLPFKVLHGLASGVTSLTEIRNEVTFKSDVLNTRDGKAVNERRETCWMADKGIGGLAYSGKIMNPVPFTPTVDKVRNAIEMATGVYYDCCLINWYADGECACKFHSDPDHGKLWSYDTVIVSVGETRRFNLRPIQPQQGIGKKVHPSDNEQEHHSFHLVDGDAFYMMGDCQDTYQHAILKSEGPSNNSPRASIVFKKSLPGPGGKRGHGIVKNVVKPMGSSTSKPSPKTTTKTTVKPMVKKR